MKRRAAAFALVALGLAALAARALRTDAPVGASLSLARKFWSANEATRVANSPAFRGERKLALDCLRAEREWPVDRDVRLLIDPSVDPAKRQAIRFAVAYRLAPRRVTIETAPAPDRFALLPAAEGR